MFGRKVAVFNYANNDTINRATRDIMRNNNHNTQRIINTIVGCTAGIVALAGTRMLYEKCKKNKQLEDINGTLSVMSDNLDDNTEAVDFLNDMLVEEREAKDRSKENGLWEEVVDKHIDQYEKNHSKDVDDSLDIHGREAKEEVKTESTETKETVTENKSKKTSK